MLRFIMTRAARTMALAMVPAAFALAQSTGRIVGRVTDAQGAGVPGAQLIVSPSGTAVISGEDGRFVARSVPSGTSSIRAYRFGYRPRTVEGVAVTAGEEATVNIQFEQATVQLGGVVTSASRRVEKITDAPATITRLEAAQIENTIGNSFASALKEVKGLEFIQTGVLTSAINARGFNSSFNNRILQLEDGRIGVLAESALPVGSLTTVSKIDLASVEVLVGPGSALYGPDASNGVVTLSTKDPRQYPGWAVELDGGTRSFYDAQARYAGNSGKIGYKVTGEYVAVDEFHQDSVFYPAVKAGGLPILEKDANWRNDIIRGSGMLAYYLDNGSRLMATLGASKLNGVGATNVGRNQLQNYGYRDAQVQYTGSRLFAQAYMSQSVSGTTFQLNGLAQNSVRFPTISYDSVKALSAFPSDGRLQAAEVQNNFSVGMLGRTGIAAIDNTHFTYGGQLRRDRISTYGHWLSDRQTGTPILINQKGVYGQMETPLSEMFRVVLAGRYDKHDKYDAQFSPKAALLFTPITDQTIRVTYNKAFKSPSVLQTDFYFPNFQPFIGVFGNLDGFDIKNNAGATVNTFDPIRPEVNKTYELGYKGVIAQKLFLDIVGYTTKFDGFISPLIVIANPLAAAATTAYNHRTGAKVTDAAGGPQIALTYFNAGQATINGIDGGAKFYFTDKVAASLTASLVKIDTIIRKATDPAEATAFNSPSVRVTGGMDFNNVVRNVIAGFTTRYVAKYDFRSGVNYGLVPAFGTMDITAGYTLPNTGAKILFQAQNIFSCVGGTTTPPALGLGSANRAVYAEGRECGFGKKHQEIINAPVLGPIVLLGLRWEGK